MSRVTCTTSSRNRRALKFAIVCCWGFPAHGKHHSGSFADERPRLCNVPLHTTYSQFRQSMAELSGYISCHKLYIAQASMS